MSLFKDGALREELKKSGILFSDYTSAGNVNERLNTMFSLIEKSNERMRSLEKSLGYKYVPHSEPQHIKGRKK